MMDKIVFATNNAHKLAELREILQGSYEVVGLKEIGFEGDIAETGLTLEENAAIKSKFVFEFVEYGKKFSAKKSLKKSN